MTGMEIRQTAINSTLLQHTRRPLLEVSSADGYHQFLCPSPLDEVAGTLREHHPIIILHASGASFRSLGPFSPPDLTADSISCFEYSDVSARCQRAITRFDQGCLLIQALPVFLKQPSHLPSLSFDRTHCT